jgi:hypothetical protein
VFPNPPPRVLIFNSVFRREPQIYADVMLSRLV